MSPSIPATTDEVGTLIFEHHIVDGWRVVHADARVAIAPAALAEAALKTSGVTFIGGLLVLCNQVAYRPIAFTRAGHLLCERQPWRDDVELEGGRLT